MEVKFILLFDIEVNLTFISLSLRRLLGSSIKYVYSLQKAGRPKKYVKNP